MAKTGEVKYLEAIGEAGRRHAVGKPFTDVNCDIALGRLGQLFALLPPPPARVLDMGCGTGWTSAMLARRGYEVVGVDIAGDMIAAARDSNAGEDALRLEFEEGDYESLPFADEFDAVVFFDSLHHAEDEEAALASAHRALRAGGVCVVSEPGAGHHRRPASVQAVAAFDVTEKEMPPHHVRTLARRVGFGGARVFAHVGQVLPLVTGVRGGEPGGWRGRLLKSTVASPLLVALLLTILKRWHGVVLLVK